MERGQNITPGDSLEAVLARTGEISTIQEAALRAATVANDPLAGASELASAIENDPVLAARIIRTVNSAAFGLRRRVAGLTEAIALLGFKRVRNLAMAAMVCSLFRSSQRFGPYDRQALWRHLVAVGVGARAMALASGQAELEEAFLAGLLHDIGIIVEDQYSHEYFVQTMLAVGPHEPLCATEARILGFDHTQIGSRVATGWRFPQPAIDAIAFHHCPEEYDGPFKPLVFAVTVANWVCTENGIPSVGVQNVARPSAQVLKTLGFNDEDLAGFAAGIQYEMATDDLLLVV